MQHPNKSVNFAPLSPTSSRRLAKIHHDHQDTPPYDPPQRAQQYQPPEANWDDNVYDDPSSASPDTSRPHRRRRRRRNSDPSSNRPNQPSKHRRRQRNPSRSPSPTSSDETVVLPDRFDRDGRPLDRSRGGGGGGGQAEMVERIVHDVGDVVEGRKSWRDLLAGFISEGTRRR